MKTTLISLSTILILFAILISSPVSAQKSSIKPIKFTEEERAISAFHSLQVSGLAVVYLSPAGDTRKVKLAVSGMPIEKVLTSVKDGVLTVTTQGIHKGEEIKVYISSPELKTIIVSGAGILHTQDTLKVDTLAISVVGVGAAYLAVDTQMLELNMQGGDLVLSGKAKQHKINSFPDSDHGRLDISRLVVDNTP